MFHMNSTPQREIFDSHICIISSPVILTYFTSMLTWTTPLITRGGLCGRKATKKYAPNLKNKS